MIATAQSGRLVWRLGTVVALHDETPHVRTLVLDVPDWPGHRPGQHIDVRLTAEDGYQAQRSYSIASPPQQDVVELTVERLEDGEVSIYLVDELRAGDRLELRGPIGGYFVWPVSRVTEAQTGPDRAGRPPLQLIAGGSGIVPLMCMLRYRAASDDRTPARCLYSARSYEELIYRAELERLDAAGDDDLDVTVTLTRSQPRGWTGQARRVDAQMLADLAWPPSDRPLIYVCGPTAFVETVARALVLQGHEPELIRTERFGPTGASSEREAGDG